MKEYVKFTSALILLKSILVILMFTLLFTIAMVFCGCATQGEKELIQQKQRIIDAYSAVLHRIWLEKPSYIEDVLWEEDEMIELNEMLGGDWGDTFQYHSLRDSIEFHSNWLPDE